MGKWSQTGYEQQLFSKIHTLFEKSIADPLLDLPDDTRFRTFVQRLDPDDKTVQACFQTLVTQMMHDNGRARRARYNTIVPAADRIRGRSVSDLPAEAGIGEMPRITFRPRRPTMPRRYIDAQRDPLYNMVAPADESRRSPSSSETEALEGGNVEVDEEPLQASRARSRSISSTFSATRSRELRTASNQQGQARDRSRSPPRSHSQAWLEEYRQGRPDVRNARGPGGPSQPLFDYFLERPNIQNRRGRYTSSAETQLATVDPADADESNVRTAGQRAHRMSRRTFTARSPAQTDGEGQLADESTLRVRDSRRDGIVFEDWDSDDDLGPITYDFSSVARGRDLIDFTMARLHQRRHPSSWLGSGPPSGDLRDEGTSTRPVTEPELNDPDEVYGFTEDGYITVSRIGRPEQSGDIEHIIV